MLNVDLGNKPKLQDITLYNATLSKLAVSNATAANLLKDSSAPAEVVELDNIDPAQAISYIKRTAGTTTKSITLKNMSLTEAQILDLISGLGATMAPSRSRLICLPQLSRQLSQLRAGRVPLSKP